MADIDFGNGSWDDARGLVQNILQQLVNDVQGNGKDGIKTILSNFITEYRTNRTDNIKFQDQRDKENAVRENRRWQLATIVLTVFGLILGVLTYLEANRQMHGKFSGNQAPAALSYKQPPVERSGP